MDTNSRDDPNPYAPPVPVPHPRETGFEVEIDTAQPLTCELQIIAAMYRRVRFSGWANLLIEWDAGRPGFVLMIVNEKSFWAKRPLFRGRSHVEFKIGIEPKVAKVSFDAFHDWSFKVVAFQISISDEPVYQDGECSLLVANTQSEEKRD